MSMIAEPVPYTKRPTLADVLLRAVAEIERDFLVEEGGAVLDRLVVACWRAEPRRYGMGRFHAATADSNRVKTEAQRMVCRGHLVRVAPNVYRLSASGRARVAALNQEG